MAELSITGDEIPLKGGNSVRGMDDEAASLILGVSPVPKRPLFGTLSTRILGERLYGLLLVPKLVSKSQFHNRSYPVSIGTPLRDVFT